MIREENPWTKVADSFFGELPLIGIFAGYLFHPRYLVTRKSTGQPVFRLSKQSALWEGKFLIEKFGDSTEQEETALTLSLLMLILLEKGAVDRMSHLPTMARLRLVIERRQDRVACLYEKPCPFVCRCVFGQFFFL